MKIKCTHCTEEHDLAKIGWMLREPIYWLSLNDEQRAQSELTPDLCVIRAHDETTYYMLGLLQLPVRGQDEPLEWGVWISLSEKSYREVCDHWKDPARIHTGPHVGYLSNRLPYYPDTLSLIARVHHREPGERPWVEMEPTDHPLAVHQRDGIALEELPKIVTALLHQ